MFHSLLNEGNDYTSYHTWRRPLSIPSYYPYFIPTTYQATSYSPYSYIYGGQPDPLWECYYQCVNNGGSSASCCFYCGLC